MGTWKKAILEGDSTLVPSGGTTGQVLAKNSNTNYDTVWTTTSGTPSNSFETLAVAGQTSIVADSSTDTLTLVAGTNVTITTDATTDSITIAASGGGTPAGSSGQIQYNASGSFGAEAALFYDATNNRLSVGGNTTPTAALEVRSGGTTTASAFIIQNSTSNERFKIQDDGRVIVTNNGTFTANSPGFSVTKTGTYWGGISLRHTGITHNQAAGNAQDSNTFGIIFTENTTAGLSIFGFTATNQNGNAVKLSGIQGTQTPTTSAFRLQGSKWNGSTGYTTIGNAEPVISYANFATELFIQLGSGAAGFKTTAPTSTTSVTVRGHGTSTNESFRVENSSGTARFVVRDDGGYGFAGGTVGLAQTGYTTFTNLTTDRTCNANATTVEELADILGTLIEDLKTKGIISA